MLQRFKRPAERWLFHDARLWLTRMRLKAPSSHTRHRSPSLRLAVGEYLIYGKERLPSPDRGRKAIIDLAKLEHWNQLNNHCTLAVIPELQSPMLCSATRPHTGSYTDFSKSSSSSLEIGYVCSFAGYARLLTSSRYLSIAR